MLKLDSISKSFDEKPVLQNISLEIEEGERFSLLGQSGCGKSTLLRLIAGFESPDQGKIWIEGNEVSSLPVEQRPVGLIFQNYALFHHMTVYDNSGGEAQRVALARAVINKPKILLLDEPLSALDPSLRQHLREELVEMQKTLGITFLFVTHDQEEAMSMGTHMCIMEKGVIKQTGTPADLYERPKSSFVAKFLGEINCLVGTVEQKIGNLVTISLGENGKIQLLSEVDKIKTNRCYVRPEKIFFDIGKEQKEPVNSLEGTLVGRDFFGSYTRYQIQLTDGTFFKLSLHHRKAKQHKHVIGDSVRVLFAISDVFQIHEK